MTQYKWFIPIESMFYEALYYYYIYNWGIEPMPSNVNTHKEALIRNGKNWPFRTHNTKARYTCHNCKKSWKSSHTTMIWRAHRETSIVQIRVEKQGCQRCNRKCQVSSIGEEELEIALDWMCIWILEDFYGVKNEDTNEDRDKPDETDESKAPHDSVRCEAGTKGTCRKCNELKKKHR
ncbi:unnamed protein product [Adineta steineri]|uniref:3CxxC-type domain-containing protein n=1 Tax=Adineta steineri TaxID=433720 RepID=A0A815SZI6_9BILA|nr:unnamed protein product [Adineta steineri]CAF4203658.1 unnamed protein product [Adineta steineri]